MLWFWPVSLLMLWFLAGNQRVQGTRKRNDRRMFILLHMKRDATKLVVGERKGRGAQQGYSSWEVDWTEGVIARRPLQSATGRAPRVG
jgi:hypothetical protein